MMASRGSSRESLFRRNRRRIRCGLGAALGGLALVMGAVAGVTRAGGTGREGPSAAAAYPYGSAEFTRLVAESFGAARQGEAQEFYRWMDEAYRSSSARASGAGGTSLDSALRYQQERRRAAAGPADKAKVEADVAAWTHRMVKSAIPRFSLERGFEFCNVVRYGERQCFLQSVLIAGLLQAAGCDAGVAMVYRNAKGQEMNNGHAVTLMRLADGTALTVDASDREPFAKHQGLLVRAPDYRYVNPVYRTRSDRIVRYRLTGRPVDLAPGQVGPLGLDFIRSQFWYYRGERAPGGVVAAKRTPRGLARSAEGLSRAVEIAPGNGLAVYMLGRVRWFQGDKRAARKLLERARRVYLRWGWVPPGVEEALSWVSPSSGKAHADPS